MFLKSEIPPPSFRLSAVDGVDSARETQRIQEVLAKSKCGSVRSRAEEACRANFKTLRGRLPVRRLTASVVAQAGTQTGATCHFGCEATAKWRAQTVGGMHRPFHRAVCRACATNAVHGEF